MKRLLITFIAISLFYGCKSISSEELAFSINSRKSLKDSDVVTEKVFTDITKSLDPIGLIWHSICKSKSWSISIAQQNYQNAYFEYTEKVESSNSSKNIQHSVSLSKPNADLDNLIYIHKFRENPNSSKEKSDTDEADFFKYYGTLQYLRKGYGQNSVLFENLNETSKDETIDEFCKKYEDAYTETESNYKVVAFAATSETIKVTDKSSFFQKTESVPTLYSKLEGINEKSGESIETWVAASGSIEGISLKTIEKDSEGTSTKTLTSYKLVK